MAEASGTGGGYVAVLVIELHFPDAGSLKSKRKDLQSIKSQLHGRFGAAVSETDHQDLWQRSTLLATLTGGSLPQLGAAADRLENWLHARCPDGVGVRRIVASVSELVDFVSSSVRGG
jgi:uncharacterized protein YlxP (DUF503 family)